MLSDALWHPLDAENYREPALLPPVVAKRGPRAYVPVDFPFRYNARYQAGLSGAGRVVNISSTRVMVTCRHQLNVGTAVEFGDRMACPA